jgi:hypothetical protein
MILLDGINLDRQYWRLELDRMPRTEVEFRALNMVLRGVDDLLAGREPGEEFRERILRHPAVAEARLRYAPAAGKTV